MEMSIFRCALMETGNSKEYIVRPIGPHIYEVGTGRSLASHGHFTIAKGPHDHPHFHHSFMHGHSTCVYTLAAEPQTTAYYNVE